MLIRWTVVEAKGRFSALIERVLRDGPQAITRNGADVVVMVPARDWRAGAVRRSPLEVLAKTDVRFSMNDGDIANAFPRLRAWLAPPPPPVPAPSNGPHASADG